MSGPVVRRFVLLLFLWLVLTSGEPSAWLVGAAAAAVAAAISTRLLSPTQRGVRLTAVLRGAPGFAWASLLGGIDVAWRAFQPRPLLKPRWIAYPVRLPPGSARATLGNELSLIPGTLAAGGRGDILYIHCLDGDRPVEAQIAGEESRLAATIGVPLGRSDV